MPAYIIVRAKTDDPARLMEYRAAVPPVLEKYRGRFLARGGATITLEGPVESRRIVLMEFASLADAKAFYDSPEYSEVRKLREGLSVAEFVAVEGVE